MHPGVRDVGFKVVGTTACNEFVQHSFTRFAKEGDPWMPLYIDEHCIVGMVSDG